MVIAAEIGLVRFCQCLNQHVCIELRQMGEKFDALVSLRVAHTVDGDVFNVVDVNQRFDPQLTKTLVTPIRGVQTVEMRLFSGPDR